MFASKPLFTGVVHKPTPPQCSSSPGDQTPPNPTGKKSIHAPSRADQSDFFQARSVHAPARGPPSIPISHSSSSIAPSPTVLVAAPPPIAPVPPPSPVSPIIAPVPPPSPVQPSTAPPLLTYRRRPPPASSPADSRPAPNAAR
uniref:Vegetative cell wall protein gp1-like n=1 Tax=Nicotiana sylvestris TaxID=4096 RepID=A0A1U7VB60_NICSY